MDLFTKHYPEQGRLEKSGYFHWHRFMRLVDGYDQAHPLWADFGDVRLPFWTWWVRHGEDLFMTGLEDGVEELVDDRQVADARRSGAPILRVDIGCSRGYLLERFVAFLDERQGLVKSGRKSHGNEVREARYPFHQRPDADALQKVFAVWKLRHPLGAAKKVPTLYDVGVTLNLHPGAVILDDDDDEVIADKRNWMNATVSRYNRWGQNIIDNVALGIFPKLTPPDAKKGRRRTPSRK